MLIVRGTKKVLDRIGGVTASDSDRSTTRLGDWYVNVLFWKPQVALFVDEVTLLPVVMPFAPGTGNYEGLYYYQWVFGTFEPPWPTQA